MSIFKKSYEKKIERICKILNHHLKTHEEKVKKHKGHDKIINKK